MVDIKVIHFTVILLTHSARADIPCSDETSVNITAGTTLDNGVIEYDDIKYLPGEYYRDDVEIWGCVCLKKRCLRKCCAIGMAYSGTSACEESVDNLVNHFSPKIYNLTVELHELRAQDHFYPLHEEPNDDWVVINPFANLNDAFYLQENGHLYLPNFNALLEDYNLSTYCLEAFTKDPSKRDVNWSTKYLAYVHVEKQSTVSQQSPEMDVTYLIPYRIEINIPLRNNSSSERIGFVYTADALITSTIDNIITVSSSLSISIIFLVATFLVYAFTPSLRNLHGKALMCYVFNLTMSFTFTIVVQQENIFVSRLRCYLLVFPNYYFIMASFFWLNILCFDIWFTFGSNVMRHATKKNEVRRFSLYSLYGWGAPCLLTGVSALMHFHDGIPDSFIRPEIAVNRCWFSEEAEMAYVYGPILILVVCNLVMFSCTTFKILKVKRETAMLKGKDNSRSTQYQKDTQRFSIYLKLFLVMGVSWTTEILSFYLGGSIWIWIFTDIINTLLGVYIFVIFVWKAKVKKLLLERYRELRYGPRPEQQTRQSKSSRTYSTGSSTSAAENDRPPLYRNDSTRPLTKETNF